jgi:predicted nucleotidyltransferase
MVYNQGLTINESRVVDFLLRHFDERNSINQVARRLTISPRGAYKILKKLESLNVTRPEKIGNAVYYSLNLSEAYGRKLAEFVLVQHALNSYAQLQAEDLVPLRPFVQSIILFGSILTRGKEARDIDVLLILDKKNYNKALDELHKIRSIKTKKIHEIVQTLDDLKANIRKKDEVIMNIIKTGQVLWGPETLIEAIKYESR